MYGYNYPPPRTNWRLIFLIALIALTIGAIKEINRHFDEEKKEKQKVGQRSDKYDAIAQKQQILAAGTRLRKSVTGCGESFSSFS